MSKFNPSEYTIEIFWKEYDNVYKMYSLYEEDYYYFETRQNGVLHSIDGEHSVYESKYDGCEVSEEFHSNGELHNLHGYASRVYQDELNGDDDYDERRYFIHGEEYSYPIFDKIATKMLYKIPVDNIHQEAIETCEIASDNVVCNVYEKNENRTEIFKIMLRQEITTYDDQMIKNIETFKNYKIKNCPYKLVEKLFDIKIKNETYKKFGLDVVFRDEYFHDDFTYDNNLVIEVYDGEYNHEITLKEFDFRREFKKCAMHNIYRAGFCKDVAYIISNFVA